MTRSASNKQIRFDEKGMVSLIVTLILMIIVTLIVLGFAQISRREQRQSLDRQLSTQAYYAAESGVNDAHKAILGALSAAPGDPVKPKNSCGTTPEYNTANPVLDSTNNVSYSCLLITTSISNIVFDDIDPNGGSVIAPLHPNDNSPLQTIYLTWSSPQPTPSTNCSGSIPVSAPLLRDATWTCGFGMLRMSLVPTDSLGRDSLIAREQTIFFYPLKGGLPVGSNGPVTDYDTSAKGKIAAMRCGSQGGTQVVCKARVNLQTTSGGGAVKYAARFTAIYKKGGLTISARTAGNNPVQLDDAQIVIDSTGKAQDVLRRIRVRYPLNPTAATPDYALQSSSSVCKRFQANDQKFSIPGDIIGQDAANPYCNQY